MFWAILSSRHTCVHGDLQRYVAADLHHDGLGAQLMAKLTCILEVRGLLFTFLFKSNRAFPSHDGMLRHGDFVFVLLDYQTSGVSSTIGFLTARHAHTHTQRQYPMSFF